MKKPTVVSKVRRFWRHKQRVPFLLLALLLFFTLVSSGTACGKKDNKVDITLTYWRPNFDTSEAFQQQIAAFQAQYGVTVEIKTFNIAEYEDELLNALAAGRGPDIFAIHNDWLPQQVDKILPVPPSTEQRTYITPAEYKSIFADVAFEDFVVDNQIYAVPLSIDTLALYYNEDHFNKAGISMPPANWTEFQSDVKKLTKKNLSGDVMESGAALGTADNINRPMDILSLLMMQNGTVFTTPDRRQATFNGPVTVEEDNQAKTYYPGAAALKFYTDFANPATEVYTWNMTEKYSIDSFIAGKTAMMVNYSYHIPTVRQKAPKLNFAVAPVPQVEGANKVTNFANYWGEVVSRQTKNAEYAWLFVQFLGNRDNVKIYCDVTKRPVSRRDLVDQQKSDIDLGVFAQQVLSARTWYRASSLGYEETFRKMIDQVNRGEATPEEAVGIAADQMTEYMKKDPLANLNSQ